MGVVECGVVERWRWTGEWSAGAVEWWSGEVVEWWSGGVVGRGGRNRVNSSVWSRFCEFPASLDPPEIRLQLVTICGLFAS